MTNTLRNMLQQIKKLHDIDPPELTISASPIVPEGKQVLWRKGSIVCVTAVGDPIEDALCDHIQMSPADYERFKQATAHLPHKGET